MAKYEDIRQISNANYVVNIPWDYLEEWLDTNEHRSYGIEVEPDFQRAHVWDDAKRIKYVEFCLRGGRSSLNIYWNCPGWMIDFKGPLQLVDGLQRLTAVRKFLSNEIPAFGHFHDEYTDKLSMTRCYFLFYINDLASRKDILQWYLDLNDGGVVHTTEELERVKKLLSEAK